MMLKHFLIAGLAFTPAILSANTIGEVTAANQGLTQEVQGADKDVSALNAVDGAEDAGTIPNDINDITNSIRNAQNFNTGVPVDGDEGTEEAYADSYGDLNQELVTYLNDVVGKKGLLTLFDQADATYEALGSLTSALEAYQQFTMGNVQTTTVQDQINESAAQGIAAASEAENNFQPADPSL